MPHPEHNGITDEEEEARIQAHIAADPDDPAHWDTSWLPASEILSEVVQAYREGTLRPASPGAILRVTLQERGLSQRRLAAMMGRPANAVSEIVQGKKAITAQTAVDLEEALGVAAQYWMKTEADYRLALERQRRKKANDETQEMRRD